VSELTPVVAEAVAAVIIDDVDFGDHYEPGTTWLGFLIDAAFPQSDIYPYYSGQVSRVDGRSHGEGVQEINWRGRPALQLSRRSNRRNGFDNAVLKTERVVRWFATT
jgi:hypothetical protein